MQNKKYMVIYKIEDLRGRLYIGSTANFKRRIYTHFQKLKENKHHSIMMQNYYNKYGKDSLKVIILEEIVGGKEELIKREQYYLDNLECYYNTCKIAYSRLGVGHSKEVRMKIAEAGKGRIFTEEVRQKISLSQKGKKRKPLTEEHKQKIKQSMLGKTHSEESKQKMSNKLKSLGLVPSDNFKYAQKGVKWSEEQKKKWVDARTGLSYSSHKSRNGKKVLYKGVEYNSMAELNKLVFPHIPITTFRRNYLKLK